MNGAPAAFGIEGDKAQRFTVVQLWSVYYPYCEMPAPFFEAFFAEIDGRVLQL